MLRLKFIGFLVLLMLLAGCGNLDRNPVSPQTSLLVDSLTSNPPEVIGKPGVEPMSIGSTRYRVRNEMWYALRKEWLTKGDDALGPGSNGTLSNWNWLSKNADANANGLRFALATYGGYVSDLIPGVGGNLTSSEENYWTDRLSADAYALGYEGRRDGHGTQCVAFVAMGIFRATGGAGQLTWNWAEVGSKSYPPATQAQVCDIVFRTASPHHVAICVRNYGSGITVVESNYAGHEVIGRRDISNAAIGNMWKVYSGKGLCY